MKPLTAKQLTGEAPLSPEQVVTVMFAKDLWSHLPVGHTIVPEPCEETDEFAMRWEDHDGRAIWAKSFIRPALPLSAFEIGFLIGDPAMQCSCESPA